MKKLAIIGGGVMAAYFGEACHRLGYEGHCFSMPDGKVDDGKVDAFHEINIFEKEKITEICRELGIDGVVATTELSIPITAYVAAQLGLLGIPDMMVMLAVNSLRLCQELVQDGTEERGQGNAGDVVECLIPYGIRMVQEFVLHCNGNYYKQYHNDCHNSNSLIVLMQI